MHKRLPRRGFLLTAASLCGGCVSWNAGSTRLPENRKAEPLLRPAAAGSPIGDNASLTVTMVAIDAGSGDGSAVEELIAGLDVGPIPAAARRSYGLNDIGVGVASHDRDVAHLLRESTPTDSTEQSLLRLTETADDRSGTRRTHPIQRGGRQVIAPGPAITESHTALVRTDDGVQARTVIGAEYQWQLNHIAAGDADTRTFRVRGLIQYGQEQRTFTASDVALRIDSRRQRWELPGLDFNWTAGDGETLVFYPQPRPTASDPTLADRFLRPGGSALLIAIMVQIPVV